MSMSAILGVFVILLLIVPTVFAEDKPAPPKGPTCQEQLNDTTVLAHNLAQDRNQKEKTLANAQVMIMQLKQRNEQLEKQVADMQKALAPKEKAAEK